MFTVQVTGMTEVIERFGAMPNNIRAALWQEINRQLMILLSTVQHKLQGDVLNYITGRLYRSIQARATQTDSSMTGRVFSSGDVKYAAIHEYGGTIHIPEIVPVQAKALHFTIGGQDVFAMRVRAHDVVMPERSFMRSSLDDRRAEIVQGMRDAVLAGVK